MKRTAGRFGIAFLLSAITLLAALAYVEYRGRNPEWVAFQKKGIALAIGSLEKQLDAQESKQKKQEIAAQLESLRKKQPEILEIRPFGGKLPPERCMTCHFGIEDLSPSHPNSVFGCVTCHGGNGPDLTVRGAHRGLRGGRNPASLDLVSASCGSGQQAGGGCHSQREHPLLNRVDNVPRSLMATNAGIIGILRFQWGLTADSHSKFGIKAISDGKTTLQEVPSETNAQGELSLSDSHFRKFCAACHLWGSRTGEQFGRLQGCPACHAAYGQDGKYAGGDPTINRNEPGHAATHTITNHISNDRCRACHNRSARIGLNYQGEMESTQYGTPFVHGGLSVDKLGDGRFVWKLVPDIHHEKGMGCVDCHTGQDTMGDGTIHTHMKDQIEIRCEDCHGSHIASPRTITVDANDRLVQTLIKSLAVAKPKEGDTILQTSKGRPLPHVKLTEKGFRLRSKLTGKEHPVSVITGKMDGHAIKGHERLECDTCHSAWSPQCYGCHQSLDLGEKGRDHISGKMTDGRWAEGRGFFRYDRNIYGLNSRGKIGILVPGCQVWNTVVDASGKVSGGYDSRVMLLKNGHSSMAMGPTHPHTTRKEVPRCVDCHLDPKALGLGEGTLTLNVAEKKMEFEPLYDSLASGLKIPFPLDAVVDTQGKVLQGTSHHLARGFNQEEIAKITAIATCLPCHDRYDDPVWRKPGPYKLTPACRSALERMGR
jgi:hypothetical protein